MGIFASSKYLEVVVHDLRTPLNVINLVLRMLEETVDEKSSELAEDLEMIRANSAEMEYMLLDLVDFSHLPEGPDGLYCERFDPRRMLDEVVEHYRSHRASVPVELDVANGPTVVKLDQVKARMAVQKAINNAAAASDGSPIRICLSGAPDRCITTVEVTVPPRDSVQSHAIDPEQFVRLRGSAAERRGLDLAIVARVSALFGGTAVLEATPGRGTAVVLDWPAEITANPGVRLGAVTSVS